MRRALSLLARYGLLELRLYAALLRWCLRRKDVPPGAEPWGYAQLVTPVMWLWIFGSATELVVLHVIIPWERVRLASDIVSAWGLLWMLGTLAAYRIRPHLLFDERLHIRVGVYHDIVVPTNAISAATVREAELPSSMFPLQIQADEKGHQVSIGVSGRTNVVLTLRTSTPLATVKGSISTATVRFWVDEPRDFVARLNAEVTERSLTRSEDAAQ